MRYDIPVRFLARVSLDAASVSGAADQLPQISAILGPNVPGGIVLDPGAPAGFERRPMFTKMPDGVSLVLLARSFDVVVQPTDVNYSNMGAADDFIPRAFDILARALEILGRRTNRLAFLQEGFLGEMSDEQLSAVRARVLNTPKSLEDAFEWDWRAGARITRTFAERSEVCNTIAAIRRVTAQVGDVGQIYPTRELDRLFVTLDVNTSGSNFSERFTPDDVRAFAAASIEWHRDLSAHVSRFVGASDDAQ